MKMSKGYTLHPLGQKYRLGLDHRYEYVYLEDLNLIGEYTRDGIEEARDCGDSVEIDVSDENLRRIRIRYMLSWNIQISVKMEITKIHFKAFQYSGVS